MTEITARSCLTFFCLAAAFSSCMPKSGDQPAIEPETKRCEILNIRRISEGSVPIRGESVYFALREDGSAELEHLVKSSPLQTPGPIRYEMKPVRGFNLSRENTEMFRKLSAELAMDNSFDLDLPGIGVRSDAIGALHIFVGACEKKSRKIVINDFEDVVIENAGLGAFPKRVEDLILKIDGLRKSEIEKITTVSTGQ
ncbi:MAG: hypothetical protein R2684_04330 [Pyrinomonadaceae bacterium]